MKRTYRDITHSNTNTDTLDLDTFDDQITTEILESSHKDDDSEEDEEIIHKCRYCSAFFLSEDRLTHHVGVSHPNKTSNKCPNCSFSCHNLLDLRHHYTLHHVVRPNFAQRIKKTVNRRLQKSRLTSKPKKTRQRRRNKKIPSGTAGRYLEEIHEVFRFTPKYRDVHAVFDAERDKIRKTIEKFRNKKTQQFDSPCIKYQV